MGTIKYKFITVYDKQNTGQTLAGDNRESPQGMYGIRKDALNAPSV